MSIVDRNPMIEIDRDRDPFPLAAPTDEGEGRRRKPARMPGRSVRASRGADLGLYPAQNARPGAPRSLADLPARFIPPGWRGELETSDVAGEPHAGCHS